MVHVERSIHISLIGLVEWVIFEALAGCHDKLGKSPIKWRKRPNIIMAVDWDVEHQFKQTQKFLQPRKSERITTIVN